MALGVSTAHSKKHVWPWRPDSRTLMMPDRKQQFPDAQKTDPLPGFCIPECGLLEEKLWLDSPRWKGRQAGLGVDGAFLCKGKGRVRRTLPRLRRRRVFWEFHVLSQGGMTPRHRVPASEKSPSSVFGMGGWEIPTLKKSLGLLPGTSPERAVQSEDQGPSPVMTDTCS